MAEGRELKVEQQVDRGSDRRMVVFIVPNCGTAGAGLPRLSPDSRWQKKIMSSIVSLVMVI